MMDGNSMKSRPFDNRGVIDFTPDWKRLSGSKNEKGYQEKTQREILQCSCLFLCGDQQAKHADDLLLSQRHPACWIK